MASRDSDQSVLSHLIIFCADAVPSRHQAYTSTLLQYAREQLLEGSFISNDSDICTSSSLSSSSSGRSIANSFLDNRQLPVRCESLGELIASTDTLASLPSSPRSAPYYLHEDRADESAIEHRQRHERAGLRDVIIHSGVGTTEL